MQHSTIGRGSVRDAVSLARTLPPSKKELEQTRRVVDDDDEVVIGAQHLRVIRKALATRRTGLQIAEYERAERALTWKRLIGKRINDVFARRDIYDEGRLSMDIILESSRALPRAFEISEEMLLEATEGLKEDAEGRIEYKRIPARLFMMDLLDVDEIAESGEITEAEIRAFVEEEAEHRELVGLWDTGALFKPPTPPSKRPVSRSIFYKDPRRDAIPQPEIPKDVYGYPIKPTPIEYTYGPGEGAFASADRMGSRHAKRLAPLGSANSMRPSFSTTLPPPTTTKLEMYHHLSPQKPGQTLYPLVPLPSNSPTSKHKESPPTHHELIPTGRKRVTAPQQTRKAFFWGPNAVPSAKHVALQPLSLPPLPNEATDVEKAAIVIGGRPPTPEDPEREAQLHHEFMMATESLHIWRRKIKDDVQHAIDAMPVLPRRTRREHYVALSLGAKKVAEITSRFELSYLLAAFIQWRDTTMLLVHMDKTRQFFRRQALKKLDNVAVAAALRFKAYAFHRMRAHVLYHRGVLQSRNSSRPSGTPDDERKSTPQSRPVSSASPFRPIEHFPRLPKKHLGPRRQTFAPFTDDHVKKRSIRRIATAKEI